MNEYEAHEEDINLDFLKPVSAEDLAARFKMKIIDLNPEEEEMIDVMVEHLPEQLRPYFYYKNNKIGRASCRERV